MLSLFTRRVALSAYRSTATYARISVSSSPALRVRGIPGTSLHASAVCTFMKPQRNASTKATVATKKTDSSTESSARGRTKSQRNLTPEQKAKRELDKKAKAAALMVKRKAREEKKKEVAALKRKRLAEKRKLVKEKKKAREAKKPKIIKPPPRRMTGFALFLKETKKCVPEGTADWKNISEEAKQGYTTRAKVVAEKRREEFKAFVDATTHVDLVRYNRLRRSRGKFGIHFKSGKYPIPPFLRYCEKFRMRPDQAGKELMEVSKAAGEAWHSLTQEEKDQYKHKPTESTAA